MGLIRIPHNRWRHTVLLRFIGVGLANTVFGYGIFALAVVAGLPAQAALIVQFVIGALWNFHLHARLVFAVEGWLRLPAYVATYVAIYAVNAAGLAIMTGWGAGPLAAQLAILPFVVLLSWQLIGRVMSHPNEVTV